MKKLILLLGLFQLSFFVRGASVTKTDCENLVGRTLLNPTFSTSVNRPIFNTLKNRTQVNGSNKILTCTFNDLNEDSFKIDFDLAFKCLKRDGLRAYRTEGNSSNLANFVLNYCDKKLKDFQITDEVYANIINPNASLENNLQSSALTPENNVIVSNPGGDGNIDRDLTGANLEANSSASNLNDRILANPRYNFPPREGSFTFVSLGSCGGGLGGSSDVNKLYNAPAGQQVCFNNAELKKQATDAEGKFGDAVRSYGQFDSSQPAEGQSFVLSDCINQFGERDCVVQQEKFNSAKTAALQGEDGQQSEIENAGLAGDSGNIGNGENNIVPEGGNAYGLTQQRVNDNEFFNLGTEEEPVWIPGTAINSVNSKIAECEQQNSSEMTGQNLADFCKEQTAQACKQENASADSWCGQWRESLTEGESRFASSAVDRAVRIGSNSAEIRSRLDFGGKDCLEYFTGSKENKNLENPEAEPDYISDKLKLIGDDTGSIYSNRIVGGLYSSSNSCQQVFGSNFTEINASEKLKPRNFQKYCMDVLQANLTKPEGEAVCQKAIELIVEYKSVGENCFEVDTARLDAETQADIDLCLANANNNSQGVSRDFVYQAEQACYNRAPSESNSKKVKQICSDTYKAVEACFKSGGDDQVASMVDISTGCVALNNAAIRIKDEGDFENGEQYQTIDSQQSGFICNAKAAGSVVYALDFLACKRAALWYNAAFVTNDMLGPIATNAVGALRSADIEGDQVQELAKGGVDAQTAALRAQRRQYQNKANMETTKGVLQGAKAMAMFGNMMFYPTPKIVSEEWCEGENVKDFDFDAASACSIVRMSEAQPDSGLMEELFVNQHAKKIMLDTGFQALSQAIVSAIVAGTYKKRAKLVGKVEQTLADADFLKPENQIEIGPDFCIQNPNVPSCRGFRGGRVSNNGGVDFSFGGGIQNGGGNLDISDGSDLGEFDGNNNAIAPSNAAKQQIEDLLGGSSDRKDTPDFKKVAAAKGSAASGGGGGGGGGGAGASGGGGGGGGGDAPKKQAAGPTTPTGKRKFGKYVTGQNGKFTSGGSVRTKKKGSGNPFAALRGKGNRKIASEVEKEILPKKVQIFEAISRRYAEVSKSRERISIDKEYLVKSK